MNSGVNADSPMEQPAGVLGSAFPIGVMMAVAMWTSGYIARLPFIQAHPAFLFAVLAAIVFVGGRFAGSSHPRRWIAAILSSAIAAGFDLLVLGAYLAEDLDEGPWHAVVSVTSFFAAMITLGGLGAATVSAPSRNWTRGEGCEAISAATFLATTVMIAIGGLVTSEEAGMAVPDWPASFGENMFLLPLSRMTGGIYYEHAHRLYGTLVGLVTLSMTIYLVAQKASKLLRWGAFLALGQVIFQGVLGGMLGSSWGD